MVKLSSLFQEQVDATVDWLGHEIVISFRPGQVTAKKLSEVLPSGETDEDGNLLPAAKSSHQWLSEIIAGWNLENDDGDLPITEEGLQSLPYSLVAAMVRTVRLWNAPTEGEY